MMLIKGGNHLNMTNPSQGETCTEGYGMLPACAPLANPYVPYQQEREQTYMPGTGMIRGTMYPGLDLPFMGMTNQKEKNKTPLHQLQSLNFAVSELGLYLDTHPNDEDAVALYNQYVEQYADVLHQYEQRYGATTQMGAALTGEYEWLNDPWPWDYNANREG